MDTSKDIRGEFAKIVMESFNTGYKMRGMEITKIRCADEMVDSILQVFKEYIEEKKISDKEIQRLYKQGFGSGAKECEEHNALLDDLLEGLKKENL